MNYVAKVRFGDELHYITEFITPDAPAVLALAQMVPIGADPIVWLTNWVWGNINYPTAHWAFDPDYHELRAFRKRGLFAPAAIKLSTPDFFEFPCEVLGWRDVQGRLWADCEGMSVTLCSVLRNFIPSDEIFVALGKIKGLAHAWVRICGNDGVWKIIESTSLHQAPLPEGEPYKTLAYFNDQEAVEIEEGYFGVLGELGELAKV